MPTLKQYVESSDKTGFYIIANVGGVNPVTVQVSPLGKTILKKAGYQPEDTIPTKLVWSMYEIGLTYTSGRVEGTHQRNQDNISIGEFLGISNKLTPTERQRLLALLREYDGAEEARIQQLITELERSKPASANDTKKSSDSATSDAMIGADVDSIDSVLNEDS